MLRRGLNASELGRRLDLSPAFVSRILAGERNPDKDLEPWTDVFDLEGREKRDFLELGYLARAHPMLATVIEDQRREIAFLRKQLETTRSSEIPISG